MFERMGEKEMSRGTKGFYHKGILVFFLGTGGGQPWFAGEAGVKRPMLS